MSGVNEASNAKQRIEDQAMRWLLELTAREPSRKRWLEFDAWLSADPEHEAVYCRFEATLGQLRKQCAAQAQGAQHKEESRPSRIELKRVHLRPLERAHLANGRVLDLRNVLSGAESSSRCYALMSTPSVPVSGGNSVEPSGKSLIQEHGRWMQARILVAVAATVMLLVGGYFAWLQINPASRDVTEFETAANESISHLLADGSRVVLGAGSELRVDFRERRRRVWLLKGEAVFDVSKNPTRPFVVSTDVVSATATEHAKFSVLLDRGVLVQVYEGIIDVSPSTAVEGSVVVTLRPGERYRLSKNVATAAVEESDKPVDEAWRAQIQSLSSLIPPFESSG